VVFGTQVTSLQTPALHTPAVQSAFVAQPGLPPELLMAPDEPDEPDAPGVPAIDELPDEPPKPGESDVPPAPASLTLLDPEQATTRNAHNPEPTTKYFIRLPDEHRNPAFRAALANPENSGRA